MTIVEMLGMDTGLVGIVVFALALCSVFVALAWED